MTSPTLLLVAATAVVVGSLLQKVSGTGVGLVVAPTLSVLLGPAVGVLVTNATTTVSAFLIMLTVLPQIDWARWRWLIVPAVPGAFAGALLVYALPLAWLQTVIGAVVLLAILTSVALPRLPEVRGPLPLVITGLVGGVFNTTAGVAAPAMVLYAKLSRWDQRAFAATMQPTFLGLGAMSVLFKTLLSPHGLQGLPPWWVVPGVVVAVLLGVRLGQVVARHIDSHQARRIALTLAGLGGAIALAKGIAGLV